jgi:hypothetical protein
MWLELHMQFPYVNTFFYIHSVAGHFVVEYESLYFTYPMQLRVSWQPLICQCGVCESYLFLHWTLMDVVYPSNGSFYTFQIDEKILNKKELEFYKWEGSLSQLLQDVRAKLNQVASVSLIALFSCSYFFLSSRVSQCLNAITFLLRPGPRKRKNTAWRRSRWRSPIQWIASATYSPKRGQ